MNTGAPQAGQCAPVESVRSESTSPGPRPPSMAAPLDFDALYEDHFGLVWRTARRLGVPPAAADDVVQDVFLVVHRRLGDNDGGNTRFCGRARAPSVAGCFFDLERRSNIGCHRRVGLLRGAADRGAVVA